MNEFKVNSIVRSCFSFSIFKILKIEDTLIPDSRYKKLYLELFDNGKTFTQVFKPSELTEIVPIEDGFESLRNMNLDSKGLDKFESYEIQKFPDLNGEIWYEIEHTEGLYKTSNYGRVKSLWYYGNKKKEGILIGQTLKFYNNGSRVFTAYRRELIRKYVHKFDDLNFNLNITEEFKDVPNFEGRYQISNFGRLKSSYYCNFENINSIIKNIYWSKEHLLQYRLYFNRKVFRYIYIHEIVGILFLPNPLNMKIINHKDIDNFEDNSVSNLEWSNIRRTPLDIKPNFPFLFYDIDENLWAFYYFDDISINYTNSEATRDEGKCYFLYEKDAVEAYFNLTNSHFLVWRDYDILKYKRGSKEFQFKLNFVVENQYHNYNLPYYIHHNREYGVYNYYPLPILENLDDFYNRMKELLLNNASIDGCLIPLFSKYENPIPFAVLSFFYAQINDNNASNLYFEVILNRYPNHWAVYFFRALIKKLNNDILGAIDDVNLSRKLGGNIVESLIQKYFILPSRDDSI